MFQLVAPKPLLSVPNPELIIFSPKCSSFPMVPFLIIPPFSLPQANNPTVILDISFLNTPSPIPDLISTLIIFLFAANLHLSESTLTLALLTRADDQYSPLSQSPAPEDTFPPGFSDPNCTHAHIPKWWWWWNWAGPWAGGVGGSWAQRSLCPPFSF